MIKGIKNVAFSVGGHGYEIEFRNNYEIVFWTTSLAYDKFSTPDNTLAASSIRVARANVFESIYVYRRVIKEVIKWVYEYKPPYFYWSTGEDKSRRSLYDRLSFKVKNLGFDLTKQGNSIYYAHKANQTCQSC